MFMSGRGFIFMSCCVVSGLAHGVSLSPGSPIELQVSGMPVLLNPVARDYNGDGAADLLYRGDFFYDADHGLHPKFVYNYVLSYGGAQAFDDSASLYVGLNVDGSPAPLAVADVNGDGLVDFFGGSGPTTCGTDAVAINSLALHAGAPFDVLFSRCQLIGESADVEAGRASNAVRLTSHDLDGDGNADFALHKRGLSKTTSVALEILLGDGQGGFAQQIVDIVQPVKSVRLPKFRGGWRTVNLVVALEKMAMIDFDGDGDLDAVFERHIASAPDGTLFVYENNGGAFSLTPLLFESSTPVQYSAFGVPLYGYTWPDWYLSATTTSEHEDIAAIRSTVLVDPNAAGIYADFNGDGVDDFIVDDDGQVKVFAGTGTGFDAAFAGFPIGEARLLTVGDFNGDGTLDAIVVNAIPEYVGNSTIVPLFQVAELDTAEPFPTPTPDPAPAPNPAPAPTGTPVELEGTITEVGEGYIVIDGTRVTYTSDTAVKFNDVSAFEVGLPAQMKGIDTGDAVVATDIEVG